MAPVTWEVAMDVPLISRYLPRSQAETIVSPEHKISIAAAVVNGAIRRFWLVAPTAIVCTVTRGIIDCHSAVVAGGSDDQYTGTDRRY